MRAGLAGPTWTCHWEGDHDPGGDRSWTQTLVGSAQRELGKWKQPGPLMLWAPRREGEGTDGRHQEGRGTEL